MISLGHFIWGWGATIFDNLVEINSLRVCKLVNIN